MGAKEELSHVMANVLTELGFRQRGDSWRRIGPTLYSIVNLQRSRWDAVFYVNLGFSLADRAVNGWLPEPKCMVRFRIEAIRELSPDDLRLLSDEVLGEMGQDEWRSAVSERLIGPIARIIERSTDLAGLKNVLQADVTERVMINAEMRALLESSSN